VSLSAVVLEGMHTSLEVRPQARFVSCEGACHIVPSPHADLPMRLRGDDSNKLSRYKPPSLFRCHLMMNDALVPKLNEL